MKVWMAKTTAPVSGKANTLNGRSIYDEPISTLVPIHSRAVFADAVPTATENPSLYQINGSCENVRFELEYITNTGSQSFWTTDGEVVATTTDPNNDPGVEYVTLPSSYDGRHAFAIKVPADYQDNSTNPNKDQAKYANSAKIHEST